MSTFNTYQPEVAERPFARKWFIVALVASLGIHAVLFFFFSTTKLEHFSPYSERLVPRAFTSLGRVDIDQKLLDPEPEKPADQQAVTQQIASQSLPADKPSVDASADEVVYKPSAPELVKPITNDKPKVDNSSLQTLEKIQQTTSTELNKELDSVRDQLIKDKPKISSNALLKFSETKNSSATGGNDSGIPGTKSLDDAIAGTGGGLHSGDKIGIRGGALFEYDKADLRPEAIVDLQKLAIVVKRYPNAIFTIEGYADSFGSAEYNLALSQRRADEVKAWLLVTVGNRYKIEAHGLGSTNFVVSPNGTVEEQEKNRRVEIGMKFPH